MSKRSNSKALTKQSWGIIKQHRYLLRFPLVGFMVALIPMAIAAAAGIGVAIAQDNDDLGLTVAFGAVLAVFMFITALVGNVFAGGLVTAVSSELQGRPSSFGIGVRAAMGHLGRLSKWSFIQVVVSFIISRIQGSGNSGPLAGVLRSVLAATAGVLWSLVTFLVMPVLMNEDTKVVASIKRSAELLKGRWGDQIKGRIRIGGFLIFVIVIPAILAVLAGVALMIAGGISVAVGIALVVIGVFLFGLALLLAQTVQGVFATVLYLYAVNGQAPEGFTEEQLAGAITQK